MTALELVVDALATHRVTHLITEDTVPFGTLRDNLIDTQPRSLLAEWVSCPWCASVSVAVVVAVARAVVPRWWAPAAAVLAMSSVTGLLSTWEQTH